MVQSEVIQRRAAGPFSHAACCLAAGVNAYGAQADDLTRVRFAPKADKSLHRSEMTRCAMSRHMQRSKDNGRNSSFDNLVRPSLQRWRNVKSECLRGLEIDHQFERSRLHYREIRRLGSLKNAACVYACLAVGVRNIRTVADEATFHYT